MRSASFIALLCGARCAAFVVPASLPARAAPRAACVASEGRRPASSLLDRLQGAAAAAVLVCGSAGVAAPACAAPAPAPAPAAAPARPLSAATRKRLGLLFKAKLAKVPVFMVTNEAGSPFLNALSSGDQSALMFLFPGEAQKMLAGVLKAPNGATSGAKVLSSNLDRGFRLARLDPMVSGLRDQATNRELTMVWQFMPHAAESRAAQAMLIKKGKAPKVPAVPGYVIDGMVFSKRGREVRPLFLCKADADAAVARLAATGADVSALGEVEVVDALSVLLQLAADIEAGEPGVEAELRSIELVPPTESLSFRENLKKQKAPLKARIVPPQDRMR